MIKSITEQQETTAPTFGDVKINQFFVSIEGNLYQKTTGIGANRIARFDFTPYALANVVFYDSEVITRILPTVTKIEF